MHFAIKMAHKGVFDAVLGFDLGTTSVKVSLINQRTCEVVHALSTPTAAETSGVGSPQHADEQDVRKIFQTVHACCHKLADHCITNGISCKVLKVGVTGQMHGVVLWKSGLKMSDLIDLQTGSIYTAKKTKLDCSSAEAKAKEAEGEEMDATETLPKSVNVSNLFTWQDGRCSPEFLSSLPQPDSHLRLATGHGCATIFWLQRNRPEFLQQFDRAGTIMDLFVALLCDLDLPIMSVQNAASWGYFSCTSQSWNKDILANAGFPLHLLPQVNTPGSIAGTCKDLALLEGLLSEGADVGVAMGDLPCSMLPILESSSDGAMNIGTSAQVVSTTPPGFTPPPSDPSSPLEYFPYFSSTYLAVAAALTGGNVLATLVATMQQWLRSLDPHAPATATDSELLFERLIQLGLQCESPTLVINPILGGERHQPERRGTVKNVGFGNLSLGEVFRATCRGVARNLSDMSPPDAMRDNGVKRIVGCGSALLRNSVLKQEIERAFESLPFVYSDRGDASLGAALAMCRDFS